jgi:tetratricopeptide (TPR) repeat protein
VPGAHGQDRLERLSIARFRDSLSVVSDPARLDDLARQIAAVATSQDDALFALRHGFTCLRLTAVGQVRCSRDAERSFDRARTLEPEWPLAWYGRGLAKLAVAQRQLDTPENLGFRVGVGAMEDAFESFAKAAQLDPAFEPTLLELARVAFRLRSPKFVTQAREAFRRARVSGLGTEADLFLWWGRLERRGGNPDSSVAAFQAYLAHGGSAGLGLLEIARTRLALGLEGGAQSYFAGAAFDDGAGVRAYRSDLELIADSAELAAFDRVRGRDRVAMLREFWTWRDHLELRPEGERLQEHFGRLHFARMNFYLENTRRHYWHAEPYQSGSAEFDDRAIIHIRHGRPTQRVRPFVYALTGNESWRYARPDGDLVFHFTVQEDLRDYRLASSIFDLKSTGGTPKDQLLLSRQAISPMYSKLGTWGRFGRAKLAAREREIGEISIVLGTTTDSHQLRFEDSLGVQHQMLVVGQVGRQALVHLAFALEGVDSVGAAAGDSNAPIRVRFAAFDSDGRRVAWLDTNYVATAMTSGGNRVLGRVAVPVPRGTWRVRLAFQTGDVRGTLLPWDSLTVGRFDGAELQVSDLMLGALAVPVSWEPTPHDTAYINPVGQFPRDSLVELYYEVYGLDSGQTYRTGLEFTQARRPVLRFEFEEQAMSPVTRVRRTLDLTGLEPGEYRLELEVEDSQGGSHRTWAPLRIVDR